MQTPTEAISPLEEGERPRRPLAVVAVCLLAIVCVLVVPRVPHLAVVSLGLIMGAVPVLVAIVRKAQGRFDWFEIFIPFSILYALYFGAGAIWYTFRPEELISTSLGQYLLPASGLAAVGLAFAVAGYATCFRGLAASPMAAWEPANFLAAAVPGALGFLGQVAGAFQDRVKIQGGISPMLSAWQQFAPLYFWAWSLLWFRLWSGRASRAERLALFLGFCPATVVVVWATVGGKTLTIVLMSLPAIAYWYARRSFPKKTVLAILLVTVFVVFPLYNTYRNVQGSKETSARLSRTLDTAARWDERDYLDRSLTAVMNRLAVVTSIAAVLRDVPESVEYRRGDTIFLAPIGVLIPRFLWPDKPNVSIGREFGVQFQMVNSVDRLTQIAPTFPAEFYWNFSLPGVVLGMFAFGAAMRAFYQRFGAPRPAMPLTVATYTTLLVTFLQFEANFSVLAAGVIKTLMILACLQFVLRRIGALKPAIVQNG